MDNYAKYILARECPIVYFFGIMICGHPKPLLLGMLTTLVNFMNSPMLVQLYLNCLVKIENLNLLGFLLIDDASGFLNANICLMVFKVIGPLWILLCWLPVVAKLMNLFPMGTTNTRNWNILNWNIRRINDPGKHNAVRAKIEESACSIFCLQETKREHFEHSYIKKFAPKRFDKFAFSPSQGASGGILVGWNSSIFSGQVLEINNFVVTILFTARHNNEPWKLSSVYGPCDGEERQMFVDWLNELKIEEENWMIMGDFNFYRSLENRNRAGGNINDIFIFNKVISNVGLQEIPLKGRKHTWSNM